MYITCDVTYARVVDSKGKINAYLDDTPILAYAQETMDVNCSLRLVHNGFGEDAYGIGLKKDSWLKVRTRTLVNSFPGRHINSNCKLVSILLKI